MNRRHCWKALTEFYKGSFFLVIWNFTAKWFFPWGLTLPPVKIKFLHLSHPHFGTTLTLSWLTYMSILFTSNHHLLMFLWSPPDLPLLTTSSSHPYSKHPRWVILVSMESVISPLESNFNIPYVFVSLPSHCIHILPPTILLHLWKSLVWVIDHPL